MAFEYNGFIHRDLEPQVRYDAEQVELLKQADVTINENLQTVNESLQTINTELNGKLTKPANPSAESAVTVLADGTVGTKLLSEISGSGGGKLYLHKIPFKTSDNAIKVDITFYSSSNQSISNSKLLSILNSYHIIFKGTNNIGMPCVCVFFPNSEDNFNNVDVAGLNLVTGDPIEITGKAFIRQNEITTEI